MRKVVLIGLLLSGCQLDRDPLTSFEISSPSSFKYLARADPIYPEGSEEAESIRIGWLETYLDDNNLCQTGYHVQNRSKVFVRKTPIGELYDITYEGVCLNG